MFRALTALRAFLGGTLRKCLLPLNADITNRLDNLWYKVLKYAPESKYPEILSDFYFEKTGKKLNIANPRTFNEKMQWLKLYDSTPLKTMLSDKFLVRDWIKEKIGEEYLIPLIGIYDCFDDIDFDSLPNKFVLKANNGSTRNILVKDRKNLNKKLAKHYMDYWMSTNYAYFGMELNYRDIKPKIIIEQYIEGLKDYKFLCFSGEPKYVWEDVNINKKNQKRNIYDLEWNLQPFTIHHPNGDIISSFPLFLKDMISLSKVLSAGFCHVRVDFFSTANKIYFGEMTFTSDSGRGKFEPDDWDLKLGNMIKLPVLNGK